MLASFISPNEEKRLRRSPSRHLIYSFTSTTKPFPSKLKRIYGISPALKQHENHSYSFFKTKKHILFLSDLERNIGDMDSFRDGSNGWRREMSSRMRKMEIFEKRSRTTFNLCNLGDSLLIKILLIRNVICGGLRIFHASLISQHYLVDQTSFFVIFHQNPARMQTFLESTVEWNETFKLPDPCDHWPEEAVPCSECDGSTFSGFISQRTG